MIYHFKNDLTFRFPFWLDGSIGKIRDETKSTQYDHVFSPERWQSRDFRLQYSRQC